MIVNGLFFTAACQLIRGSTYVNIKMEVQCRGWQGQRLSSQRTMELRLPLWTCWENPCFGIENPRTAFEFLVFLKIEKIHFLGSIEKNIENRHSHGSMIALGAFGQNFEPFWAIRSWQVEETAVSLQAVPSWDIPPASGDLVFCGLGVTPIFCSWHFNISIVNMIKHGVKMNLK